MREHTKFKWTTECKEVFQELKKHMHYLPVLKKSVRGETLFLHLSVNIVAVNAVLMMEDVNAQLTIYHVRKLFALVEKKYIQIEN